MEERLRVFVASSSEKLAVARGVGDVLRGDESLDVHTWDQDVFTLSASYIESLEAELDRADFAIVILTADDPATVRREAVNLPRDNVVYELGLFMGRLGRARCFFFVDGDSATRIASDLSGVRAADFYNERTNRATGRPSLEDRATEAR